MGKTAQNTGGGPNFETVWQILQETSRELKENARLQKETDRQMKETDKKIAKLDGFFSSQWGKFIESLVEGDLIKLLNSRGIHITTTSTANKCRYQGREYEFDIVAVNQQQVVVVEVKTNLRVEDVNWFLENLAIFRKAFSTYTHCTVYGAVAYLKVLENADKYAYRNGLFVIRATGNSATIVNDAAFVPKLF